VRGGIGGTLLFATARFPQVDCLQAVVDAKADVLGFDGQMTMFWAAQDGNVAAVQTLLGANASIESAWRERGWTPLIAAAQMDRVDVLRVLVEAKANLNHRDSKGLSALIWAAQSGHSASVQLLIDANADIEAQCDGTALIWAAGNGHKACVQRLLDAKADIEARTNDGRTAVHRCACVSAIDPYTVRRISVISAVQYNQIACLQLLVAANADLEAKDEEGRTALLWAAMDCNSACLQLLVDANAEIEVCDGHGQSALMLTSQSDLTVCTQILLLPLLHNPSRMD